MGYVDPDTIYVPTTGQLVPTAWLTQVRSDLEFLISPPQCSVSNSGNQSVATSTHTALTADTEQYDTDTMHSTSSNTDRVTTTTAGKYMFTGVVQFAANGTGYRNMRLVRRNAAGTIQETLNVGTYNSTAVPDAQRLTFARPITCAAGDYVTLEVWQNSGGNLNVQLLDLTGQFTSR